MMGIPGFQQPHVATRQPDYYRFAHNSVPSSSFQPYPRTTQGFQSTHGGNNKNLQPDFGGVPGDPLLTHSVAISEEVLDEFPN